MSTTTRFFDERDASAMHPSHAIHSATIKKPIQMQPVLPVSYRAKIIIPVMSMLFLMLNFLSNNSLYAQGTMGRWQMCGLSGAPSEVSPTGVSSGVVFSALTRGPGINAASINNAFSSNGWSTSNSLNINNNDYYEFTITPDPGHSISISALKIRDQMSNTSFDVSVRYSDNNYGGTIGSGGSWTASTNPVNRTVNMSGVSSLQNRTTPVTFRIYGTDASNGNSTYRLVCQGTNPGQFRGVDVDGTVAQASYAAQFISMDYGSSPWCRGELRDVSVTVKNVGSATWNSAEPVNIGLKWNEDVDYGAGPSFIPRQPAGNVVSGQTVTYTFPGVAASTLDGNNNLTFDVVRELVCWFGNNNGGCGPGNTVFTSPTINVSPTPAATTVTGAGTFCNSTTINASGGTGGTIYFQGTTSNGTSTATAGNSAVVTESGTYYFRSRNAAGCWGDEGSVTVTINTTPSISVQPESQGVCVGGNFSVSVTASASPAPTYQWNKDGNPIGGETGTSFQITGVSAGDAGNYTVDITNSCGTTTSDVAALAVNTPPAITADPVTQNACEGQPATFTVSAAGANLEYQWRKDGVNIAGANSSSYTIAAVSSGDIANYDVVVTSEGCAPTTSASATLQILTRPTAAITSTGGGLCVGATGTVSGTVTATGAWTLTLSDNQTVNGTGNDVFSFTVAPTSNTTYTLIALTDAQCASVSGDFSGSTSFTFIDAPIDVSITPLSDEICNGQSITLTGSGSTTATSGATINNDFSTGITVTGTTTGNRSQVFEREGSGTNVNSTGTFTSPNGSGMLVATSADQSSICFCVAEANSSINTTAVLSPFSTEGYSSLNLTFNHAYQEALVSGSGVVEVSTDGNSYTTLTTYTTTVGSQSSFAGESISLDAYVGQPNLYVRFVYTAVNSSTGFFQATHATWWAIDDIAINGTTEPLYSWQANTGSGVNGLPAGAEIPSANNKVISVDPSATTVYTLIATHSVTGCETTETAEITVIERPTAVLSGDDSRCDGDATPVTLTLTVTGSGTLSGTLSDGTPFSGTAPTINVNVSPTVTTTYTIATLQDEDCVANAGDLSGSATVTIISLTPVSVSIVSSDEDDVICSGTSVTFTATPVNGGSNPSYQWLLNGNPVGSDQDTYTTSALVNGDVVSVLLTSDFTPCASGNPATSNSITTTVDALQPVSVTITSDVAAACAGSVINFSSTSVNEGTNPLYQWYVNGLPITDSVGTTFAPEFLLDGDVVTVILTSDITPCATQNPATSNAIAVGISPIPQTPGPISGITDACPYVDTNIPVTFSIDPVPGAASYTWTVPANGVNVISGQGTTDLTVTFTNSFALTNQYFRVATNSSFPCTSPMSDHEVLKIVPAIAGPISGPTNVCTYAGQPGTATYSIDPVPYATGYTWTAPPNATIVSGQGTLSVEVSFSSAFIAGSIRVTADANCGSRAARSLALGKQGAQAPGPITGPTNACPFLGNLTEATYSIDPVANATNYEWVVPANCNIVSGQGTTSINVTFNSNYNSGQIRVRAQSACNNSGYRSIVVANATYGTPGLISGPTNACGYIGTANLATYSINAVPGAPSYLWTVPAGCTIVNHPNGSGANDTIIEVAFDASFVSGTTISVQATGCITTAASTLQVIRTASSNMPGIFDGPTNVCEFVQSDANPGGTPVIYTVRKATGATSYNWTAPANSTIVAHPNGAGENDTIVHVIFNSNFTSGVISVSASSGCGNSEERTRVINVLRPMAPGGITATEIQSCPNRIISYSVAAIPGNATGVYWTVPAGATLMSGQGSTSITVSYPSDAVFGYLTAAGINNCSMSNARSLKVRLDECEGGKPQLAKVEVPEVKQLNVTVYPNPSTHQFKVQIESPVDGAVQVRVLDITGREIQRLKSAANQTIGLGGELKAGTYFVEVIQQGNRSIQKVIKL